MHGVFGKILALEVRVFERGSVHIELRLISSSRVSRGEERGGCLS